MQWVEITHKLESSPLDDSVNKQGESALKQVSDAHDIHVPLCPSLLSEFNGMKYSYSHQITRQYMLASTAFLIENPPKNATPSPALITLKLATWEVPSGVLCLPTFQI